MKKATTVVIEKLPALKKHVKADENMFMRQHTLRELSDVECAFIELIWFFEDPETNDFDLKILYERLDNEWLTFALDIIKFYFEEDTYLIQTSTDSVIITDDYYDQSRASRYLIAKGLESYSQNKIATYIYRGTFPKEDLLISGKKYWTKHSLDLYVESISKKN